MMTTEIIERPILMTGGNVRSILEHRKTHTRRIMKPQPSKAFLDRGLASVVPQWPMQDGVRWFMRDGLSELVKCPYGKPGDRLWVKETHAFYSLNYDDTGKWHPSDRDVCCHYRGRVSRSDT